MGTPGVGPLAGRANLDEAKAPKVSGKARPLAPGEFIQNPDGSWSNEIAVTVQHPKLNDAQPTNVPSLWVVDGRPVRLNEDQAAEAAASSGLRFKSYENTKAAIQAAQERESQWQKIKPQDSGNVPSLWSLPPTPTARPEPTLGENIRGTVQRQALKLPEPVQQAGRATADYMETHDPFPPLPELLMRALGNE